MRLSTSSNLVLLEEDRCFRLSRLDTVTGCTVTALLLLLLLLPGVVEKMLRRWGLDVVVDPVPSPVSSSKSDKASLSLLSVPLEEELEV